MSYYKHHRSIIRVLESVVDMKCIILSKLYWILHPIDKFWWLSHFGNHVEGQFRHHPSASPAVIVRKVVGHHLFLNIIPINFTARTEWKVWCDQGMRWDTIHWHDVGCRLVQHKIRCFSCIHNGQSHVQCNGITLINAGMCKVWLSFHIPMLWPTIYTIAHGNMCNTSFTWTSSHSLCFSFFHSYRG